MLSIRRAILVAATAVLSASCGDSGGPAVEFTPVDGHWSHRAPFTSRSPSLEIDLVEDPRGNISGFGMMISDLLIRPGDVAGTRTVIIEEITGDHDHPQVIIVLRTSDFGPITFEGRFTAADAIRGSISGATFLGEPVELRRVEN